jgi:hypothetical protein
MSVPTLISSHVERAEENTLEYTEAPTYGQSARKAR